MRLSASSRLYTTQIEELIVKEKKWTLVQHSGFGYGRNPQFRKAVEIYGLGKEGLVQRVEKAGGIVVDDYDEVSNLEYEENYPEDVEGLVPQARGSFSNKTVGGLRIYILENTTRT